MWCAVCCIAHVRLHSDVHVVLLRRNDRRWRLGPALLLTVSGGGSGGLGARHNRDRGDGVEGAATWRAANAGRADGIWGGPRFLLLRLPLVLV